MKKLVARARKKRTRQAKGPRHAAPRYHRNPRHQQPEASTADHIQAQREQLFRVIAIMQCCKYATATSLDVMDSEYMVTVFDAMHDLLDQIAGQLGVIADDLRLKASK